MKRIKFLMLFLSFNLFCACPELDEIDSSIKIVNNTSKDIYFWGRGEVSELIWRPNKNFLIASSSTFELKGKFIETLSDGSKFYIWIFDRQVIDTVPWEQVKENNMYLKRYDLTLQELEAMNWEVIYDGS